MPILEYSKARKMIYGPPKRIDPISVGQCVLATLGNDYDANYYGQLLAAAPEMLSTMKDVANFLRATPDNYHEAVRYLEDMIGKARGD